MEIQDLRAIYLPDMESTQGVSTYTIIKSRDGLHWGNDVDSNSASFDLPFIDEDWMIMNSVQETDSAGHELYEMDIVELKGYYQKYFIVIRVGHSFVLFDGATATLNDPEGKVWSECKYVCPIWNSASIEDTAFTNMANKLISI
jgi:hypothetical protein